MAFLDILFYSILVILALIAFKFAQSLRLQRAREAQGVRYSGTFAFFTDLYKYIGYLRNRPTEIAQFLLMEEYSGKDIPPIFAFNQLGTQIIAFNDCSVLEELYVTKNAFYTKHPLAKLGGLIDNFLTADSNDPVYKRKRKVLSGALMKLKMSKMQQVVKKVTLQTFAELQEQGDKNVVCINKFTSKVLSNIIVSLLVGPQHIKEEMEYTDLKTGAKSRIFVQEFLDRAFEDVITRVTKNPLLTFFHSLLKDRAITVTDGRYLANLNEAKQILRRII